MYEAEQKAQYGYAKLGGNTLAPPTIGINSALTELSAAISTNVNMSENLRSILGISTPEAGNKNVVEPTTMLAIIQSLTYAINRSIDNLNQVNAHLYG